MQSPIILFSLSFDLSLNVSENRDIRNLGHGEFTLQLHSLLSVLNSQAQTLFGYASIAAGNVAYGFIEICGSLPIDPAHSIMT